MGWFNNLFGQAKARRVAVLQELQSKFALFKTLLDRHNQVLKKLSRLEEKNQNRELRNLSSVWDEFVVIREGVNELVERMIELGGVAYVPLRGRLTIVSNEVERFLPSSRPVPEDDLIIPFSRLGKERAFSVGGKNANLGEMKSRLGLPVPDGFAVSAFAYRRFIESNQLQDRIKFLLTGVRIKKYQDLEVISDEIRETVGLKPIPEDVATAILQGFDELQARSQKIGFALRSSAVGEDSSFTFAGQYQSFLNVRRELILENYKKILASKFTPSAISYLFSHSLSELDLAMGVVCMEMVDSAASGVVYTRDPLDPESPYLLVNSIFGLGSYLVDGTLTPDVFRVAREDQRVLHSKPARKPVQLAPSPEGGVREIPVPEFDQDRPSLSEEKLAELARYALQIEAHYGGPQDLEWALSRSGELYLIQTRPLMVQEARPEFQVPPEFTSQILLSGGTPICAGVGAGPVFHLQSSADLDAVPRGAVLVAANPSPYLVAALPRVSALVTLVGGSASHLATLARELSVPTVAGMAQAAELPAGKEVTVDAGHGAIYAGSHPEWTLAAQEKIRPASSQGPALEETISRMIAPIVRLEAIHSNDSRFTAENCRSFHDVARFIHQKSMEAMFSMLKGTSDKDAIGLRLKTKIPLLLNIIYLDREDLAASGKRWVAEDAIASRPMKALWDGVLQEGWPETPVPADLRGFLAVVGSNIQGGNQPDFSENSYAFLSEEYMLLNLRMGYHFSTFEALVTPEPEKNYVRMQFKLGGAPLERRMRRIWILTELLRRMGFENVSSGDFLDSAIAYQGPEQMLDRLRQLGRITILTKQLDMTLSSDSRARWYLGDFLAKLGLDEEK